MREKIKYLYYKGLRFGLVSTAIFLLIFTFLYGSAYFEVFSWKLKKVFGFELESVLDTHNEVSTIDGLIKVDKAQPQSNIKMADFDMTISPPDDRIIIAKVAKNMPLVEVPSDNLVKGDSQAFEADILNALKDGVVHYPLTAKPGEFGNVVLTGHSSYYAWDDGAFKDAFAIMHNVEVGDKITLFHNQNRYIYEVVEEKVVSPDDLSVLEQPKDQHLLTTITCTPIGTNTSRLIHIAKQIYPEVEN